MKSNDNIYVAWDILELCFYILLLKKKLSKSS